MRWKKCSRVGHDCPFIEDSQDFRSGVIFILFGLAAILIGRDYSMGSAGRMAPAYIPTMLGGVASVIGSMIRQG